MPHSIEEVVAAVLEMSEMDRHKVLDRIENSLAAGKITPDPAWSAELDRRYEEYVTGKDPGIPLAEFRRMMQKQLENGNEVDDHIRSDEPFIHTRIEPSTALKPTSDPELTAELNRRWAEYLSGKMQTIPLEEVYRIIDAQLADTDPVDQPHPLLSKAKKQELQLRVADADANPSDSVPWEEVQAAALARFSR